MKKNFFDYVDKKRKSHSNKYEQYACYSIWFFMKYGFCSKDNLKNAYKIIWRYAMMKNIIMNIKNY